MSFALLHKLESTCSLSELAMLRIVVEFKFQTSSKGISISISVLRSLEIRLVMHQQELSDGEGIDFSFPLNIQSAEMMVNVRMILKQKDSEISL